MTTTRKKSPAARASAQKIADEATASEAVATKATTPIEVDLSTEHTSGLDKPGADFEVWWSKLAHPLAHTWLAKIEGCDHRVSHTFELMPGENQVPKEIAPMLKKAWASRFENHEIGDGKIPGFVMATIQSGVRADKATISRLTSKSTDLDARLRGTGLRSVESRAIRIR